MLPRTSGLLLLGTVLSACTAGFSCHAQLAETSQPVRYHFGDDPDGKLGWAAPSFDDSDWPVAQDGLVPSRSRDTDRFLWVHIRVPVPNNLNAPLALHLSDLGFQPMAWQVFVNGRPIGGQGTFPPQANPADPAVSPVMPLPPALASPGSVALVALREWYAPAFIESGVPGRPTAAINHADATGRDGNGDFGDDRQPLKWFAARS